MADLCLTNTMNAAETLLQPIGVPGQVIVNHQMRPLKVDAFTRSIRGDQNANAHILLEKLFCLSPFVTEHTTMDGHNSLIVPKQRPDFSGKIIQCILVLCEDD